MLGGDQGPIRQETQGESIPLPSRLELDRVHEDILPSFLRALRSLSDQGSPNYAPTCPIRTFWTSITASIQPVSSADLFHAGLP